MANLGEAFGQHMLEPALHKLRCAQLEALDLLGATVPVSKSDLPIFQRFQARLGDRDAEDITPQVVQHFLPAAGVLGMNDPFLLPDRSGDSRQQPKGFEAIADLASEDHRQGLDGNQELGMFGGLPVLTVGRQTSGADQKMGMGMIEQGAGPSVQHSEHARLCAQPLRVGTKLLQALRRRLEQQSINGLLVRTSQCAQLGWQRKS